MLIIFLRFYPYYVLNFTIAPFQRRRNDFRRYNVSKIEWKWVSAATLKFVVVMVRRVEKRSFVLHVAIFTVLKYQLL